MSSKHSPLPWKWEAVNYVGGLSIEIKTTLPPEQYDYYMIGQMSFPKEPHAQANADLIVTAVNEYPKCQESLIWYVNSHDKLVELLKWSARIIDSYYPCGNEMDNHYDPKGWFKAYHQALAGLGEK